MRLAVQYHVRSLFRRPGATALTVLAIALSVSVLVVILALSQGFERSLAGTGRSDNLIVLRRGATSEGESGIGRDKAQVLTSLDGLAKAADGRPLAGPELYAAVSLPKQGGGSSNIPFRGVSQLGIQVQSTAKIGEGRWFRPGTNEVVIGRTMSNRIQGGRLGGAIPFNGKEWPVVGVIDAPGQAWQSEIWGDVEVLVAEFDRSGYNSVVLRVAAGTDPRSVIERIDQDPRLQCKALDQLTYYEKQTGMLGVALEFVGWFLALVMAIGSAFGATNTLLASLQGRRREIGSLLAIGFRPFGVFTGFLIEALLLGLMGGILGVGLGFLVHGFETGTTNWQTFTEQAFSFQVTASVLVKALIFGSLVGVVGGTIPAWRASRLLPTEALRAL